MFFIADRILPTFCRDDIFNQYMCVSIFAFSDVPPSIFVADAGSHF